jgi:hypothetical protein
MLNVTQMGNAVLVEWTYDASERFVPRPVVAECMDCGKDFRGDIPAGFIYDDPAAGWRQDAFDIISRGGVVAGFCKPCADFIADAHHADIVNGNSDRRYMEDERIFGY